MLEVFTGPLHSGDEVALALNFGSASAAIAEQGLMSMGEIVAFMDPAGFPHEAFPESPEYGVLGGGAFLSPVEGDQVPFPVIAAGGGYVENADVLLPSIDTLTELRELATREQGPNPSDRGEIDLPDLVVVDGDWQVWQVAVIKDVTARGQTIDAFYEAGPQPCMGFVGYALEWRPDAVIVRIVEGRNAEFCNAIGYPTTYSIPLHRPLGDRQVVPQPDGEDGATVVQPFGGKYPE